MLLTIIIYFSSLILFFILQITEAIDVSCPFGICLSVTSTRGTVVVPMMSFEDSLIFEVISPSHLVLLPTARPSNNCSAFSVNGDNFKK